MRIDETMTFMNEIFYKLIKDITPDVKEEIKAATKLIANKIMEDCSKGIEELVNPQIEKSLAIPDNVILHQDYVQYQARNFTDDNLTKLEEEIVALKNQVKENVMFINLLKKEWNSYEIDESLKVEAEAMNLAEKHLKTNAHDTDILLNNFRNIN